MRRLLRPWCWLFLHRWTTTQLFGDGEFADEHCRRCGATRYGRLA